ncbi:DUF2937 family protein [Pelagibius litoralis]|uniref:DUF2937 family protein n=1 Tax=Pelagibius litoralis TaxID=374515 RepID=A0A967EZI6_9PROT|nr:DUF2937 family protein [Pelagibius litoralis]NIA70316.1 DUF2937 family protein [Pelagibius litoralis]
MFARFFYTLFAAAGGAGFSQFPEYLAHYLQRLGGRIDQARVRVSEIKEDAAEKGMSVPDYIASFTASDPHGLEGERMRESFFDLADMETAYAALTSAPTLQRPVTFIEHFDSGLVGATLGDFAPALPLTPEGFIYGATGALAGLLLCGGSRRVLRRRKNRKVEA